MAKPKKEGPTDKDIFMEIKEYFEEIPEKSSPKKDSQEEDSQEEEVITKDKIFKKLFENPAILLMFLKDYVKEDWVKDLKIENIHYFKKRFTSLFQKDRESDVVFRIENEKYCFYFILLLEHQSRVDHFMAFRILEYMILIWRSYLAMISQRRQKRKWFKIPLIIPIVFYEGRGKWTAFRKFQEKVQFPQFLSKYVPHFEYKVVALYGITDEELKESADALSLLFLLDKCRDVEEFQEKLKSLESEYWEKFKKSLERSGVLQEIGETVQVILSNCGASDSEIEELMVHFYEGRYTEMFENSFLNKVFHERRAMEQERESWSQKENVWSQKENVWSQKENAWSQKENAWSQKENVWSQKEKNVVRTMIQLLKPLLASQFQTSEGEIEFYLQELEIERLQELSSCYMSFQKIEDLQKFVQESQKK